MTQRLSLNLGLRYEFRTPLHDKNDLMTSFDLETSLGIYSQAGRVSPSTQPITPTDDGEGAQA